MHKRALLLAAVTAAAALSGCGGSGGFPVPVDEQTDVELIDGSAWVQRGDELVQIDADGGRRRVAIGVDPYFWDYDGRHLWVATAKQLVRVDPRTRRAVGDPIDLPGPPGAFATDVDIAAGVVWLRMIDGQVMRIDGQSGRILGDPIRLRGGVALDLIADADAAYAISARPANLSSDTWITRIDARSGATVTRTAGPRDGIFFGQIAAGDGYVWVTQKREAYEVGTRYVQKSATLIRLDARTLAEAGRPVPIPPDPQRLVVAGGAVWVADGGGLLTHVDAAGLRELEPPGDAGAMPQLATDGRRVYAGSAARGLSAFDARSGRRVGAPAELPPHLGAIVVQNGVVWALDTPTQDPESDDEPPWTITRIEP